MKIKNVLMCVALLMMAVTLTAVPAKRGLVKAVQPDGTTVSIQLHGDEWLHFTTTTDGYTVEKDAEGFYVYAEKRGGQLRATQMRAHDAEERKAEERAYLQGVRKMLMPEMTEQTARAKRVAEQGEAKKREARRAAQYDYNNFKGLIVLVEWSDKSFSRSDYKDIITDMVNKENYTGYGTQHFTGSVRDYFSDNSGGRFKPQFDIVGPYAINFSQYAAQGGYKGSESDYDPQATIKITNAALTAADQDVDFSQYDGDGDGKVDLVYFIFAGNGANFSGNSAKLWWPHRSHLVGYENGYYNYMIKDGVLLDDYASSTELMGYTSTPSTVKIDGIGTIVHEFSHVLGLPDFYDTDYEKNGQSNHPGGWSVMAGGSYENNSRTPVGYSLYERYAVGFCDEPPVITAEGNYTLPTLASSETGFRLNTPEEKEYFLLENRQKTGFKWDAYLPGHGMLVHRVDFSDKSVWSMYSDNGNKVNAYASHNYYEVVRARGAHKDYSGEYEASAADTYPGTGNQHELTNMTMFGKLKTWTGKNNRYGLFDIKESNGVITFSVGEYRLESLSLTESLAVGVGLGEQLEAVPTPAYANYELSWTSSDETVATVSATGVVRGVAPGTCTITATSDNGLKASCQLTVEAVTALTVSELKELEDDKDAVLALTDGEVLYVHKEVAYVRDASGAITLDNSLLGLKQNDRVAGSVAVKKQSANKMTRAIATAKTNRLGLDIEEGAQVMPREVSIDELTEADYADYVLVKAARLVTDGVVWATGQEKGHRARLWNYFGLKFDRFKDYEGKYFDIAAIYGTDLLQGELIDELYMLALPVEVDNPTAISNVTERKPADGKAYNLSGQQVTGAYRGIVVKDGRKYVISPARQGTCW